MKREIARELGYRLIACGPVTLVTTFYKGDMNVMTASWLTPLSYRPMLIGLSVHHNTLTHELLRKGGELAINLPSPDLIRQVRYCGAVSGRDQNKLKNTGLHEEGPRVVRAVLIEECIAHLECAVVDTITPGDHSLFVLEILHAQAEAEAFDETWLLRERDLGPLHHLGGERYSTLSEVLVNDAPLPKAR